MDIVYVLITGEMLGDEFPESFWILFVLIT